MVYKISFGTDGWRAVISDEFTFANVRIVAQAIAEKPTTITAIHRSVRSASDENVTAEPSGATTCARSREHAKITRLPGLAHNARPEVSTSSASASKCSGLVSACVPRPPA